MGLLSGLSNWGLGNLENLNVFEDKSKDAKKSKVENNTKTVREEKDFIFDKSYTCPVCDHHFKEKTVRAGRVRMLGTDSDMRPRHEGIDVLKYETVVCKKCGFATLSRNFGGLSSLQMRLIRENITSNFKPVEYEGANEVISYEEALPRYKLCLANAVVKHGKESEKAYICLKTAWLIRGMRENLDKDDKEYSVKEERARKEEEDFLSNALEGFITARMKESFPICGMDADTVEYLIAMLAMHFGKDDIASRMIMGILTSQTANARIKNKARDVKYELKKRRQQA